MFREFANISPSFDLESGWRVLMVLFGKVLKQLGLKMLFLFFLPKTHHLARPLQRPCKRKLFSETAAKIKAKLSFLSLFEKNT
jgi:hypothetical protein